MREDTMFENSHCSVRSASSDGMTDAEKNNALIVGIALTLLGSIFALFSSFHTLF